MATEHSRAGNFRVMSEKVDKCPHNLSDLFTLLALLSMISIIIIVVWAGFASAPDGNNTQIIDQMVYNICIAGAACLIFIFIQAFLPKRCGVKIFILEGEDSEHHYYIYYQYTNNDQIDVQKVRELLSVTEQRAQKMNENQVAINAEKQVCCNKHQSIMAGVEQDRENHGN